MSLYATRKSTSVIVVHCTATPEGRTFTAKDIDRMHRAQGWNGIGYHYVIRLDGTVEAGRPITAVGAHVGGHNSNSIGISYVGGVDAKGKAKDTRTPAQTAALILLIKDLLTKFPGCKVVGHRDLSPDRNGDGRITPDEYIKECPCFNVIPWWESVKGTSPAPASAPVTPPLAVTYEVVKGDTLFSIAARHETTVEELKVLNGLKSNTLKIGQRLTLKTKTYVVVAGDTLYGISRRFNVTVDELAKAAGINPNRPLQVGQTLQLP